MVKLVSVIIPCFNAQRWLSEAINSCLEQSYPNLEIIVIDDGSTDNSLQIIKSYQSKIRWESSINRGGNYARNRGFALSNGEYIQFLDADDYLLPEKIEKQVRCLEKTGGDAVYSDWRYQTHLPNGQSYLEEINICGPKKDFLESLLSNEGWVPIVGLLFTRAAVNIAGGWDESLKAAQDRDFLMSLAINGGRFVYQSGCDSLYRSYGKVTVSTSSKERWLNSHSLVMEKAANKLSSISKLSEKYRQALCAGYFDIGREYLYSNYPQIEYSQYLRFLQVLDKGLILFPEYKVKHRNRIHQVVQNLLGCRKAEILSYFTTKTKTSLQLLGESIKQQQFSNAKWPPKQPEGLQKSG